MAEPVRVSVDVVQERRNGRSAPAEHPLAATPLTAAGVLALQSYRHYPSVSLLLRTSPGPELAVADRSRLEGLAREARRRLIADPAPGAPDLVPAVEQVVAAVRGPVRHGLALYVSPARAARIDLPVAVEDRCVVDPTFATRDLVRALHRTPRHVVLLLSADEARLLDGGGGVLTPVHHGFPRTDPHHRRGEPAREQFLREVDQSLGAYLRLHPAPLVIVAAQPTLATFRRTSRHTGRLAGTVTGHHLTTPLEQLGELIRPVLEDYLLSRQGEALTLLAERGEQDRAVRGLPAAWLAARWERPEMLVVEQGYLQPARLSADGDTLIPAEDADAPDVLDDAVDELIELVLSRGGWVALLADGTLPADARVALTVRR